MEVSCIILAGGRSKRIRKFKPLLTLKKKPLISYILKVVRKFFSDIVIVVKNAEQKKKLKRKIKRVKIVEDGSKIFSPVSGIKEGIKHIRNKYVFIIACDMPFINEKIIRDMLPRIKEKPDCIVYWHALNKFEPLAAIYKKNIFEKMRPNQSLQDMIKKKKNKILIPVSRETLVFFNINSQKDLNYARAIMARGLKKFLYK